MNEYLTVQEAAKLLRVSVKTVRRWIVTGRIKALCVSSSQGTYMARYRLRLADIESALAVPPPAPRPQRTTVAVPLNYPRHA